MKIADKYMLRAIQLGKNALGTAAPNPMVGCCIVHDDRIIGEGYTSAYGGAHAEVNAIASVTETHLLTEATLYVTLEPCSHFGKTPPCSDLIIEKGIPRVVVGTRDPHDKVSGRGIRRLQNAGVTVHVGLLEAQCRYHHRRFLTFHEQKRPYVILKWAESWDGFLAPDMQARQAEPAPFWITNANSRQLVHQWRSEEQAILVGTKTVLLDNPRLNVRHWKGDDPLRVVLDRQLRIPPAFHVFDGSVKTLVLTEAKEPPNLEQVIFAPIDFEHKVAEQICTALYDNGVTSILIEGGGKTLKTFIEAGLWDEARIFKGQNLLRNGLSAPQISGTLKSTKNIQNDTLTILEND